MFFYNNKIQYFSSQHIKLIHFIAKKTTTKNIAGVKNSQTLDVKILELLKLLKIINCLGTFVVKNTF